MIIVCHSLSHTESPAAAASVAVVAHVDNRNAWLHGNYEEIGQKCSCCRLWA